jgi:hypothetical protein
MIFHFFATERVFRVAQYDGTNDFVAFELSGEERPSPSSWLVNFTLLRSESVLIHSSLIQPPKWRCSRNNKIIRALRLKMRKTSSYGPWRIVDEIEAIALKIPQ